MQKGIRVNEGQLLYLANKAKQEKTQKSYLYKKSADTGKWQQRWFLLYQNLLFYFENENVVRPSGIALLEGCYCERTVTCSSKGKDSDKQVRYYSYLLVLYCCHGYCMCCHGFFMHRHGYPVVTR